jgi:sterol desaturase/sphingolipid hydroxylase (fatty acid hydroxylase superfamily)
MVAAAGALLLWEQLLPLRRRTQVQGRRSFRNLVVASGSAAVVGLIERPLADAATRWARRRRFGLLNWLKLPHAVEMATGVLLLDYTLYQWHRLTHAVPLLWRFHLIHHLDRDLDASTGVRFHFGEMLLSVPYRVAQLLVLGIPAKALRLWKLLLFPSILFHHSNVRLPRELERRLSWFLVTPRMHGIHHSEQESERDSNWGSYISLWDLLHRTYRLDVPQRDIVIGLPNLPDESAERLLLQPFQARTR